VFRRQAFDPLDQFPQNRAIDGHGHFTVGAQHMLAVRDESYLLARRPIRAFAEFARDAGDRL
jgi:hypothetical protein